MIPETIELYKAIYVFIAGIFTVPLVIILVLISETWRGHLAQKRFKVRQERMNRYVKGETNDLR